MTVNIICDVLTTFFGISYGATGLAGLVDGPPSWCSNPGTWCLRGRRLREVLAGLAMGMGVAYG